jgi:hypothetical protein
MVPQDRPNNPSKTPEELRELKQDVDPDALLKKIESISEPSRK